MPAKLSKTMLDDRKWLAKVLEILDKQIRQDVARELASVKKRLEKLERHDHGIVSTKTLKR